MRLTDLLLLILVPIGLWIALSIPSDKTKDLKTSTDGSMVFAEPALDLVAEDEPFSSILVHTEPWCGPCQRFRTESYPALIERGWSVTFTDGQGREVPRFKVQIGDYSESWSGYSSRKAFSQRLQEVIENYEKRRLGDTLSL